MIEPGGQVDLALEALRPERGRELRVEQLQGHPPIMLQVVSEVDRGHAATPELSLEPVAIRQAACKLLAQVSHSGP